MNPEQTRLRQQEQNAAVQSSETQQRPLEFSTVEELLRYDSEQNPVPSSVSERLGTSIEAESKPARSWLRKLFG